MSYAIEDFPRGGGGPEEECTVSKAASEVPPNALEMEEWFDSLPDDAIVNGISVATIRAERNKQSGVNRLIQ